MKQWCPLYVFLYSYGLQNVQHPSKGDHDSFLYHLVNVHEIYQQQSAEMEPIPKYYLKRNTLKSISHVFQHQITVCMLLENKCRFWRPERLTFPDSVLIYVGIKDAINWRYAVQMLCWMTVPPDIFRLRMSSHNLWGISLCLNEYLDDKRPQSNCWFFLNTLVSKKNKTHQWWLHINS